MSTDVNVAALEIRTSRCITVSDSICAAQTLFVQPRLYLCLSLTLSVKICANNTDMSCNSEKKDGKSE